MLAPIKYLSSDRIVTWFICSLYSVSRSFPSHSQICNRINIRWGPVNNLPISCRITYYVTASQWILVRWQIGKREVEELLILYNLRIHHVLIQSELKYRIPAKFAETIIWNRGPGLSQERNRWFMYSPGNNLVLCTLGGLVGGLWPRYGPSGEFQPGPKPGNLLLLLTLLCTDLWETSSAAETSAEALWHTWCHILTPVVRRGP